MRHLATKVFWGILFATICAVSAGAEIVVTEPGFQPAVLTTGLANPQDMTFFQPGGAYGPNLFVTEYDADAVSRIDPAGVKTTLASDVRYAVAILFGRGAYGNQLFVSESYSRDGDIVRILPDGSKTTFATGIDSPLDMAWGKGLAFGDELYVASANANKIVKVSPAGTVSDFATDLDRPSVLAFSPGGVFGEYLYVTNTDDGQIVRIAPDGAAEVFVTGLTRPIGLAFGNNTPFGDYLYVSDKTTGEILKISPAGAISGFAAGLDGPVEIHFSEGGLYGNDMLIADGEAGTIVRITPSGVPTFTIGPMPSEVGRLPFTFSFTLTLPQGIGTLADFHFIYNGIDVTSVLLDYLIACIVRWDDTSITVAIPGLMLPPGIHTVVLTATDLGGRTGSATVTYSVR
jgi:DNA-binding beta-propeller fold protein YncE